MGRVQRPQCPLIHVLEGSSVARQGDPRSGGHEGAEESMKQRTKERERIPKWAKDARDAGTPAQWPENWETWHIHGLELIVLSGCVSPKLFNDAQPTSDEVSAPVSVTDGSVPWVRRVAGYLLAGVAIEILLKAAYLKRGYSIRDPAGKQVAKLGSPEAQMLNPRKSASLSTLLRESNLRLICADPKEYEALTLAKWWRDDAAHSAVTNVVVAGVQLVLFCGALRHLHSALLSDATAEHCCETRRVLEETRPIR